jgi:hypothetical protein
MARTWIVLERWSESATRRRPPGPHGALPWPRVSHMLRNKVVFDAPPTVTAALNSPARHDKMREYATFPKFTGPGAQDPMRTAMVGPSCFVGEAAAHQRDG